MAGQFRNRLARYQGLVCQRKVSRRQAWQIPRTGIIEIGQSETGLANTRDWYSRDRLVVEKLGLQRDWFPTDEPVRDTLG